ncbi:unnamed protein product [Brassica oleracea var. botrytis]
MSRFVHVMNGQWRKSQEGVWRFDHYSALQAHDILVGRTYHVEAIKGMVRDVFRLHMIRGNEFLYSQSVMAEIFNEDEMVLLYRFSLEIEKAKNSLDLNLGPTVESGDHIVPSVGRTWIVNRVDRDRARMNTANGYGKAKITVFSN